VRHCLRRDPQRRWTVAEIAARLRQPAPAVPVQPPARIPPQRSPTKWRGLVPAAVGGLALAAVLAAPRLLQRPPDALQSSSAAEQPGVQGEPAEVVDRVLPAVPQSARDTIRGTIRVSVRVRVDPSGSVSQATLESPGPSRYFANLALQAARRWKFAPAKRDDRSAPNDWILRFEFTQETTRAFPTRITP
jgi:TonB family protein